jgi:hypothetical protein
MECLALLLQHLLLYVPLYNIFKFERMGGMKKEMGGEVRNLRNLIIHEICETADTLPLHVNWR